ncbi:MAG TPA: hypothetical protein PKM58_03420 [Pyrinomonadaceae bacterium]|nr:hypothetical protein [Pyrinomonadaceae bacterium]HNU08936.1 hypothetical protein [Pyrinomonadaceae bacterium]
MKYRKWIVSSLVLSLVILAFAPPASAKDDGYSSIVRHLKTHYSAKKVGVPFMWLAKLAVKVVKPAGVKSFSVTIFEDLKLRRDTLDAEMQAVMRNSMSAEWSPILRVRTRDREQAYMYMREAGENVRIMLVTIDNDQAVVVRAKLDPDKLAEFLDDPKIFGISLGDTDARAITKSEPAQEEYD